MIRFERTRDLEIVRSILTHPAIWRHVIDDGGPDAHNWQPCSHPLIWYVLAYLPGTPEGEQLLGLYAFYPENSICYQIHTAFLPNAWGGATAEAGRQIFPWMWRESGAFRIVASVPDDNRLVLRYAERSGMTRFGVNEKSFCRGGKFRDQILLGISRPE